MVPWKKWYDSTGSKFVGRERQCTCPCIDWGSTTSCKSCKSNKEREHNKLLKKCTTKSSNKTGSNREATEQASTKIFLRTSMKMNKNKRARERNELWRKKESEIYMYQYLYLQKQNKKYNVKDHFFIFLSRRF